MAEESATDVIVQVYILDQDIKVVIVMAPLFVISLFCIQRRLRFDTAATVWTAKMIVLNSLAKV